MFSDKVRPDDQYFAELESAFVTFREETSKRPLVPSQINGAALRMKYAMRQIMFKCLERARKKDG